MFIQDLKRVLSSGGQVPGCGWRKLSFVSTLLYYLASEGWLVGLECSWFGGLVLSFDTLGRHLLSTL